MCMCQEMWSENPKSWSRNMFMNNLLHIIRQFHELYFDFPILWNSKKYHVFKLTQTFGLDSIKVWSYVIPQILCVASFQGTFPAWKSYIMQQKYIFLSFFNLIFLFSFPMFSFPFFWILLLFLDYWLQYSPRIHFDSGEQKNHWLAFHSNIISFAFLS